MNQPVRPEDVRVGDDDRQAVAARLGRAQAEGRLDLAEYDERLQAAYGARTAGELSRVTADLPAERPAAPVRPAAAEAPGRGHRGAVAAWASVSTINVVVWAVVCVAAGSWVYPWWIWVAGPWGAVLLAEWVGGWVGGRVGGGRPTRA